ncbi:hypothetical protein [Parabacteroides provencensis]|uniref:hypothetical protein n=1 Tax=Parabacteroides provencensis TaxID=1944636 RepID=UPI000C1607DC|nr:hypothetical protein [Parabacteroides provencensis]
MPKRIVMTGRKSIMPENNCHIVHPGDRIIFPISRANVINRTVKIVLQTTDNVNGIFDRVTDGILVKINNPAGNDDYIDCTIKGQEGNAIVAVFDGSGVIKWSYHLWIVNWEPTVINGFLSRNIGALSDAQNNSGLEGGLLFQWGRKDPILYSNGNTISTNGAVEYGVKNPDKFITSYQGGSWYNASSEQLWDSAKTIYDPSPEGFRVSRYNEFNAIIEEISNTNLGGIYGDLWFPKIGTKIYTDGSIRLGDNRYWTSKISSSYPNSDSSYMAITSMQDGGGRATGCPLKVHVV